MASSFQYACRHGGQVNSRYDDPHDATGRFDFVLANPPFKAMYAGFKRGAPKHDDVQIDFDDPFVIALQLHKNGEGKR